MLGRRQNVTSSSHPKVPMSECQWLILSSPGFWVFTKEACQDGTVYAMSVVRTCSVVKVTVKGWAEREDGKHVSDGTLMLRSFDVFFICMCSFTVYAEYSRG